MSSLELEKRALRARAQATRDALSPAIRAAGSKAAGDRILDLPHPRSRVALFSARGSEIDPGPLGRVLEAEGAFVTYPRVEGADMVFAGARPEQLVPGGFGLLEPPPESTAVDPGSLDLVLVPGLLFSIRDGHRLGYGKGYFDRALGALSSRPRRPLFVGFGFEAQVVAKLPFGPTDVAVDVLVTEAHTRWFSKRDER